MSRSKLIKLLSVDLTWYFIPYINIGEPDPPGKPEFKDWSKDHVDLKWEKPANDGGAPITAYIVEKKDRDTGKWVKAAEVSKDLFFFLNCWLHPNYSNSKQNEIIVLGVMLWFTWLLYVFLGTW